MIIFEGYEKTYDLYFIPGELKSFSSLSEGKDTVVAFILQASEWGTNSYLKSNLEKEQKFDSTIVQISQENHLGQKYEATFSVFSTCGRIKFNESSSYKLAKRYKNVQFPGKLVVIQLEQYIPIISFMKNEINN